ncbi:MAG: glycine--tRNA ligase [SAR202 cluster bacterium]|nr:glycine--tRNA ligase [SAR202 cluster bacterium]
MTQTKPSIDLSSLMSLCKRRGFIFQSSEIYGGLASTWDYGPLGVELKRNIKDLWWRKNVWERDDMVGLDAAILMHPQVWVTSGHVANFNDPLTECKSCNARIRPDHIKVIKVVSSEGQELGLVSYNGAMAITESKELRERADAVAKAAGQKFGKYEETGTAADFPIAQVPCPQCGAKAGNLTEPRLFNLMFDTYLGPVKAEDKKVFLRPETAQGIFVNFNNVLTATRKKLPFGIAQVGKAFRNEITTGNFIFRTREFEQMEIEYFVKPQQGESAYLEWVEDCLNWYCNLGVKRENLRIRPHDPEELSHYSTGTSDIEYMFPWGWGELSGVASRTDFDLKAHSNATGQTMTYFDEETKEHITPYVIEPSMGVERALMVFLLDAYNEEEMPAGGGKSETRIVLRLHPALAPVKVAVLPLSRNEKLAPLSSDVFNIVRRSGINGMVQFDDSQSIGRRYRRQDEIGTPLCVTVDFDSLEDKSVTIRERDSMQQVRVKTDDLVGELKKRLGG